MPEVWRDDALPTEARAAPIAQTLGTDPAGVSAIEQPAAQFRRRYVGIVMRSARYGRVAHWRPDASLEAVPTEDLKAIAALMLRMFWKRAGQGPHLEKAAANPIPDSEEGLAKPALEHRMGPCRRSHR